MTPRLSSLAATLLLATLGHTFAQEEPAKAPTWHEMIAKGMIPYRQLTVEDFPIDDALPANQAYRFTPLIEPGFYFQRKVYNGFVYAHVEQWVVYSGWNRKTTVRNKAFKTIKAELPYLQALLDTNELFARQLAALKPGELPNARGNSFEEAQAELDRKVREFVQLKHKAANEALDTFTKATKNGVDKKKVKELAADIRKRLEATPATTVPYTDATAEWGAVSPGGTMPSPSAQPSPAASRGR